MEKAGGSLNAILLLFYVPGINLAVKAHVRLDK